MAKSRLVYSSDQGSVCPDCGRPRAACACGRKTAAPAPVGDGVVRVGRETKGRRGKAVTVITGVPLAGLALAELAKALKARCGAGGTVKSGVVEIQGDHRDAVVAELSTRGWTVKRVGG